MIAEKASDIILGRSRLAGGEYLKEDERITTPA